jgi:hypothetical protein
MPYDYAVPHPRPAQLPGMTLTEPTPPPHSSDLPTIPENNAPVGGLPPPPRQPTGSNLSAGRQRSLTENSTTPSLTNSQSGWLAAVNSAIQRDNEFMDEWQRSMDVLLIFVSDLAYFAPKAIRSITIPQATLFAAIITAFLIETFKELRGQSEEIIALLSEISQKLGGDSSVAVARLATDSSTESLHRVRRVNQLWFASLAITIGSAIFAMLAKQWITEYTEGLGTDPKHTSRGRLLREARLREFRFAGLRRWYVPEIIGTLPILLHVVLLLFGVGLVDFFWNLEHGTAIIVIVFVSVIFSLYSASVTLPSFFPDSPYRTPISHLLSNLMRTFAALFNSSMRKDSHKLDPQDPDYFVRKRLRHGFTANGALLEAERKEVEKEGSELDLQFLMRLKGTTRSDTIAEWAEGELEILRHAAASAQQPHVPPNRTTQSGSLHEANAVGPQDGKQGAFSEAPVGGLGLQTVSPAPAGP